MRGDGAGPVHDLSLGNPSLEPPACWRRAVAELLADGEEPGRHRYMTNAGFPEVREFIARREGARYGLDVRVEDVVMTVGAAGALNVLFRAVLDPGDEVVVPAPYFSEYDHYCHNHQAKLVPVRGARPGFALDPEAIERAISERTRIVLLNSPNNPTGAIYSARDLTALGEVLRRASTGRRRSLWVVEDAPYRDLVYDGSHVSSMLEHHDQVAFVTSHSKDLGLAGERIGYIVVSPRARGGDLLARAAGFCNRTLGFVNAPALMQRALPHVLGRPEGRVDVEVYAANCRAMAQGLRELGFGLEPPRAGFFLFPELPATWTGRGGADDPGGDIALTDALRGQRTIVVPGTAFGVPGHLRLSMCVVPPVVEAALVAFRAVCA
jgi:aspartate aminotransferase